MMRFWAEIVQIFDSWQGPDLLSLGEFNLLVSGSPWPMKRAVAPGGKSLIFHGGVGPGWIFCGWRDSWLSLQERRFLRRSCLFPARARVLPGCSPACAASNPRLAVDSYSALRPFG